MLNMIDLIVAALILILMPVLVLSYQATARIQDDQRQLRDAIEEAQKVSSFF
jgi:hypothetical protein